jgi:hypothetical protein
MIVWISIVFQMLVQTLIVIIVKFKSVVGNLKKKSEDIFRLF